MRTVIQFLHRRNLIVTGNMIIGALYTEQQKGCIHEAEGKDARDRKQVINLQDNCNSKSIRDKRG